MAKKKNSSIVLEDILFSDDSRHAESKEMAYRIALDFAKGENAKTFPLSA